VLEPSLFSAFGTLADSILSLAPVVDTATGRLRQQIALDSELPVLDHIPAEDTPATGRRAKA
jgi:hypothetical protein